MYSHVGHRENLSAASLPADRVTVRCADSIAALPELADTWPALRSQRQCQEEGGEGRGGGQRGVAAILDPPWGGIHYKRRRLHERQQQEEGEEGDEGEEGEDSRTEDQAAADADEGALKSMKTSDLSFCEHTLI